MEDGRPQKNDDGDDIYLFSGPTTAEGSRGIDLYVCEIIDRQESGDYFYNYTILAENHEVSYQLENVPH